MYKHAMMRQLRDYGTIRRMQPVLKEQIEAARWKLDKHGDRITQSGQSRSRALERMESTYSANREFISDIECCLEVLTEREKTVIHHFYVERTWDYIEILNEKLGVERSQLYRIKDKAIKKLALVYFGV